MTAGVEDILLSRSSCVKLGVIGVQKCGRDVNGVENTLHRNRSRSPIVTLTQVDDAVLLIRAVYESCCS